jgi:hypothetical protein
MSANIRDTAMPGSPTYRADRRVRAMPWPKCRRDAGAVASRAKRQRLSPLGRPLRSSYSDWIVPPDTLSRMKSPASLCWALAIGALVIATPAADARLLAFKSPSGNITCVMSTSDGTFAQCELRSMRFGGGFSLPPRGKVTRYDVGYDDLAGRRFVLDYGESRRLGRYRCTSRNRGMTCRNRISSHGFFVSRERQRTW